MRRCAAWATRPIVTNGDQTDTIRDFLAEGKTFADALRTRAFEPDAPNFTPARQRLMAHADERFTYLDGAFCKAADASRSAACAASMNTRPSPAGEGAFHAHLSLRTAIRIPSFEGEPERRSSLDGDIDELTEQALERAGLRTTAFRSGRKSSIWPPAQREEPHHQPQRQ